VPPVTVAGDVHLAASDAATTSTFLAFLGQTAERGGTLVLLGDVFDFWVGRRQTGDAYARRILDALGEATRRGLALAFVAGNRDYAFDGAAGLDVALWPDVVRTRWGARTVVLSHGDLLCSADRAYLRMRRLLRSRPARGVLRALPFGASSALARGLRDVSERSGRRNAGAAAGIDYGLARAWLDGYGADALVLGHVHSGVHHRLPGSPPRDVYVLKDWERAPSAVVWDGGEIALRPVGAAAAHG
jgi:UDP-2,3-diacylglucosamine hydrolase